VILDARGNPYRTPKRIGFHGEPSCVEDECDISFDQGGAKLPKWVTDEFKHDEAVAARKR